MVLDTEPTSRAHDAFAPAMLDSLLPTGGALASRLFTRLLGNLHDDPPLAPGTRVGPWRIGGMLGCGGSATVYLADRDDGHFDQQVALKVVRPQRELIERFRRERQILAGLRHASIARLIDGGEIARGRLWFAMEPVFGERIDHYVRNRCMPLPERLALLEAVCEAVAYAHARQLIHRDIKPGNLLVDETGRPRLLDFGIATSDDDDEEEGVCAMTPVYASPEQFAGDVVTFASDVYQLGALLRALTLPDGQPCATLPRTPRAIIVHELEAVAARATRIEAGDRYASVSALRADIAAIRQRRCTSMSGTTRHKTRLFVERHAVGCLCGGVGVLAPAIAWLTMRLV